MLDLMIRRGQIVTGAGPVGVADIGICNGVIAQIGGDMQAKIEIDAANKLVIPGGIDAHVHLTVPPQEKDLHPNFVDDFTSGSRAALAGGVTTVGNISYPDTLEGPLAAYRRNAAEAKEQIIADLFLHPTLFGVTPQVLADIPNLLAAGCNSIKIFMVMKDFDAHVQAFLDAIQLAGRSGLIALIHCEDDPLINLATRSLIEAGRTSLCYYAESRPVISELVATQRAAAFAEATGAPLYIVHLSSARALQVCVEALSRGLPIYVETRPLYLHLTQERFLEPDGAKYIGMPPLREQRDVDALWAGIRQGVIHTVCTDHAPWLLADKLDPSHVITDVRPGVADLQTMLPVLYSEGVRTGRITLGQFVRVTSTNAAKLFGLFPRKGIIAVGSDADLVILDPDLTRTIVKSMLLSNSDYSPFEGWQITGWPVATIRRGEIVYRDGEILGKPGSGKVISRGRTVAP